MFKSGRYQQQKKTQIMSQIYTLALAFGLTGCQTIQKPAWDLPAGTKTLSANGYPMAFQERGVGPTVVLVHGTLQDYKILGRASRVIIAAVSRHLRKSTPLLSGTLEWRRRRFFREATRQRLGGVH